MHKRNVIAILLTAVVFIAAVVLGVYSVYRVDAVTLNVSVISAVAREEADALGRKICSPATRTRAFFPWTRESRRRSSPPFPIFA